MSEDEVLAKRMVRAVVYIAVGFLVGWLIGAALGFLVSILCLVTFGIEHLGHVLMPIFAITGMVLGMMRGWLDFREWLRS